jgi:hypothetical protein
MDSNTAAYGQPNAKTAIYFWLSCYSWPISSYYYYYYYYFLPIGSKGSRGLKTKKNVKK